MFTEPSQVCVTHVFTLVFTLVFTQTPNTCVNTCVHRALGRVRILGYPYYALMSDFDEMLRNLCDDGLQVREPSGLLDLRRLAWCLK